MLGVGEILQNVFESDMRLDSRTILEHPDVLTTELFDDVSTKAAGRGSAGGLEILEAGQGDDVVEVSLTEEILIGDVDGGHFAIENQRFEVEEKREVGNSLEVVGLQAEVAQGSNPSNGLDH